VQDVFAPGHAVAQTLAAVVDTVPGWTPVDQLLTLFNLAVASAPLGGDVLEVGSWCGRSAVALGLAALSTGRGRVHCIDLFPQRDDWRQNPDGSYSMAVHIDDVRIDAYERQTVWREPFERDIAPLYRKHASVREVFEETLRRFGVESVVTAYRGTSEHVLRLQADGLRLRVAFIDGDHAFGAVRRDIENITPSLLRGGWLCFDDAFTSYEGVDAAIRERVIDSTEFDVKLQLTRKMFAARRCA
jgi:predicted O-methyltransferase YrrM